MKNYTEAKNMKDLGKILKLSKGDEFISPFLHPPVTPAFFSYGRVSEKIWSAIL